MFDKLKEIFRETKALARLNAELAELWPDAAERQRVVAEFRKIHRAVECPHNESHVLTVVLEMVRFCRRAPNQSGVFVEAGCFKGGSTAKLSLVAKLLHRRLVVFDSFEGIPANREEHTRSIFGYSIQGWFDAGSFAGSLDEVRGNVERYGDIGVCEFVPGWFDDTLPGADLEIAGAYIDVDLAASTRTCLKYLYPRLVPGGFLVSQDGDFPLVIDVFDDDAFWEGEVGCKKPTVHGLRQSKMLTVYKP